MPKGKKAKDFKLDDLDKPLTDKEMKETTGGTHFSTLFAAAPIPGSAPNVSKTPSGSPAEGKTPIPPSAPVLSPGLHVQVTDGMIVVSNNGGSAGFHPGQFGHIPNPSQPPVVVPPNPGIQFVPPPAFKGKKP